MGQALRPDPLVGQRRAPTGWRVSAAGTGFPLPFRVGVSGRTSHERVPRVRVAHLSLSLSCVARSALRSRCKHARVLTSSTGACAKPPCEGIGRWRRRGCGREVLALRHKRVVCAMLALTLRQAGQSSRQRRSQLHSCMRASTRATTPQVRTRSTTRLTLRTTRGHQSCWLGQPLYSAAAQCFRRG